MRIIVLVSALSLLLVGAQSGISDIVEDAIEDSIESQADMAGDAIETYMISAAGHVEFSKNIAVARQAYFANPDSTKAKAEFHKYLRAKDHYFFVQLVGTETTKSQLDYVNNAAKLQGGLDGGLNQALYEPYLKWAGAVKRTLEERHGKSALLHISSAQYDAALKDNEALYTEYCKYRDAFEAERHGQQKKVTELRQGIGKTRELLNQQNSHRYLKASQFMRDSAEAEALAPLVAELDSGELRSLWCEYGPTGVYDDGTYAYELYVFWQDRVPTHLPLHQAAKYQYLEEGLQNATALSACPKSRSEAKALSPINRKPVYDVAVYAKEREQIEYEQRVQAGREKKAAEMQAYQQANEERSEARQAENLERKRAKFVETCAKFQALVDTRASDLAQAQATGKQNSINAATSKLAKAQQQLDNYCGPNRCDNYGQALQDAEAKRAEAASQGQGSKVDMAMRQVEKKRKQLEDCLALSQ